MSVATRWVKHGSAEWQQARELRFELFFRAYGLPRTVMDDGQERAAAHLVALDAGLVIACGRLCELSDGTFQISQMAVSTTRQNMGTGGVMLQRLIGRARQARATCIVLNARLAAARFYGNAGFVTCGEVFSSRPTGLPHVKMTLDVERPIEPE